jgi:hypothetical protein
VTGRFVNSLSGRRRFLRPPWIIPRYTSPPLDSFEHPRYPCYTLSLVLKSCCEDRYAGRFVLALARVQHATGQAGLDLALSAPPRRTIAITANVQRLLKPRTPADCPACRQHMAPTTSTPTGFAGDILVCGQKPSRCAQVSYTAADPSGSPSSANTDRPKDNPMGQLLKHETALHVNNRTCWHRPRPIS